MEIHEKLFKFEHKKYRKWIQNAPKMTLRSSLEPLGALLGCRVSFKTSFGSHFGSFWEPLGDPVGSLWGAFSDPVSLRAILGPQIGGLLEGSVLTSLFETILDQIWIHFWSLWDTYDLDDMREGW